MERIKYHHKNVISKVDATSNTKEEDLHDERWRRDWKRSEKTYWPTAMYAYHLNRDSNSKRSWHLRQLEIWTLATDHIKEGWLIAPRSDNNVILFLKVVLTFSQIVTYLKMSGLSFKQTVRGQRKWGGLAWKRTATSWPRLRDSHRGGQYSRVCLVEVFYLLNNFFTSIK